MKVEMVSGKEDMRGTPSLEWLTERLLFNLVQDLPVFTKYRYSGPSLSGHSQQRPPSLTRP